MPARREVRAEPPRQPSTPEGRAAAARRARQQISHNTALRLLRTSAPVKMHVVYTNAGGAVLQSEGLEGFMPLMMMDAAHTAEVMLAERELLRDNPLPIAMDIREVQSQVLRRAMMVLLHREVTAYVYKVDLASYSIILSEQPPDQHESGTLLVPHEARHILLQNLRETVDTTVHRVMQAGAVLEFDVEVIRDDVQTIYGIVPREEVSWDATQSPGDVVQPGQSVRAKIIGVDLMRGRVFLSLKQTQQDPLLQSLDSFMQQQASVDAGSYDSGLQTKLGNLPEVDAICAALNSHPDIESAAAGRRLQGRASAPELQVFLARAMPNSSAPAEAPSTAASAASAQTGAALNQEDTQGGFPLAAALPGPQDAQEYELLARVGIDVQDIHVRSRLDREAMKAVLSGIVAALGPAS
ncbi:hypothetical protein WJX72_000980 [[Myrmecia] bisecta]|uniref:S1 motif domain-containing protein n=1 Tax=[Myrmecia] bisecta TaxID=41462 RepID=A0AAW1PNY5_9CHLO